METTPTSSGTQMNQLFPRGESRKLQRFPLGLHTRIIGLEPGSPTLDLMTKDISSGGAFFPTSEPLPEGLAVHVELTLKRQSGLGKASKVHLNGWVIRSRPDGMAVIFGKQIQMIPC